MTSPTASTKLIAIIGATGGTGLACVEQSLKAGYRVRVLVRNASAFNAEITNNPNFEMLMGSVTDVDALERLFTGATDIINSLGGKEKNSTICSDSQPVINKALLKINNPSTRLITVTSISVGDNYWYSGKFTRAFASWIIPNAITDKNKQEREIVRSAHSNWCIVRPAGLGDGPVTGKYQIGDATFAPAGSKQIARQDVAHAILANCLSGNDTWLRLPMTVGYPPRFHKSDSLKQVSSTQGTCGGTNVLGCAVTGAGAGALIGGPIGAGIGAVGGFIVGQFAGRRTVTTITKSCQSSTI